MNHNEIQQILSILDTIHDYGNTSRVKKVIEKKENIDEFNPAFIIDFLMLGYLHQYFRDIVGLSKSQHYLKQPRNCNVGEFVNSKSTNKIVNLICKEFYYPTYGDKIIYRSPSPEETIKTILFEYLKEQNIIYSEKNTDWDNIKRSNCIKLKIGNKKEGTGIYSLENEDEQSELFYKKISYFYNQNVAFVADANKLNNKWFCINNKNYTKYHGLFIDYDGFKQISEQKGGGNYNTNSDNNDDNELYDCFRKEFQNYGLTQENGELLKLINLNVLNNKLEFISITLNKNKYIKKDFKINLDNKVDKNDPRGLSLFLLLFNEINKKTLGYLNFDKGDARSKNLEKDIKSIGYNALKSKYNIGLDLIEINNIDNKAAILKPVDFILTLFDLKRSMDYLYVKATYEANLKNLQDKYIFVSSDSSAVHYALLLNTPCILTPNVESNGDHFIILYNPQNKFQENNNIQQVIPLKTNTSKNNVLVNNAADIARSFIKIIEPVNPLNTLDNIKNLKTFVSDLSKNQCQTFINDYNSENEKITNPFTQRKVSKTNNIIKKLYDKCTKQILLEEEKEKEAQEFIKEIENEEQDERNENIIKIIKEGIQIKTISPSKHFGEVQIKTRLEKYNLTLEDFCVYLDRNKNDILVQEFNQKIILKSLSFKKVCPTFFKGGYNNTILETTDNSIDYLDKILSNKIPLKDLTLLCEVESPMYIFFNFYKSLNYEIEFFWFIVFKSLLFFTFGDDMDKKDCKRYIEMNIHKRELINIKNMNKTSNFYTTNSINKNDKNNILPLNRSLSITNEIYKDIINKK